VPFDPFWLASTLLPDIARSGCPEFGRRTSRPARRAPRRRASRPDALTVILRSWPLALVLYDSLIWIALVCRYLAPTLRLRSGSPLSRERERGRGCGSAWFLRSLCLVPTTA
jgi:hypothetical protein